MTAVWSKLTAQLSTWLADGVDAGGKRRSVAEPGGAGGDNLRPSHSLSALSQPNCLVRPSKSTENLHWRLGGVAAQQGCLNCADPSKGGKRLLFSARQQQTDERESGYSSCSPSRRKSGAGISFFPTLRGRNKAKREKGADLNAVPPFGQPSSRSDASSSGASSSTNECAEAQKKRWWLAGASWTVAVPFVDEEDQSSQTDARQRRPSAPEKGRHTVKGGSTQNLAHPHSLFPNQHYLISPPKRPLGAKRTESAFSAFFSPPREKPGNSGTAEDGSRRESVALPMSASWSSKLASQLLGSSKKQQHHSPPGPAPTATVPQLETTTSGHFNPASFTVDGEDGERGRQRSATTEKAARKRSSANRLVAALLNARWRKTEERSTAEKRSRSVGANQQMRISATMHTLSSRPLVEVLLLEGSKLGSGLGQKTSLAGHEDTFFGAPQVFRTPQQKAVGSCASPASTPPSSSASPRTGGGLEMFRRLEKLGEGSYAVGREQGHVMYTQFPLLGLQTVWKSENRLDGSIVALKEIRLQEQEGLPFTAIREISLLRALRHANIVRLHQIVIQHEQPRSLVLVFEYMRTDLAKFMEHHPHGLDAFRTKLFLFQLLRGLAFCHERKILHRDLKPQNLLVNNTGELKLADFGLARAKSVPCRTFSHDVVTLWYRPPDVLLGSTAYSTSLDMWGVGCIFAEMCSGTALFPGASDVEDQLERIFSVRGVPHDRNWPEARQLPKWGQFLFADYEELDWAQVDAQLDAQLGTEGRKLLSHLLQLNPRDRLSAEGAMLHKYFEELPRTLHALLPNESVLVALSGSTTLVPGRI